MHGPAYKYTCSILCLYLCNASYTHCKLLSTFALVQAIILFGNLLALLVSMTMFCILGVFLTPSAICAQTIMFTFMYTQSCVTVCLCMYCHIYYILMLVHVLRTRCVFLAKYFNDQFELR